MSGLTKAFTFRPDAPSTEHIEPEIRIEKNSQMSAPFFSLDTRTAAEREEMNRECENREELRLMRLLPL